MDFIDYLWLMQNVDWNINFFYYINRFMDFYENFINVDGYSDIFIQDFY